MTEKRNKRNMSGNIEIFTDKEIFTFLLIINYDRDKLQFESECNR